MQVIDALIVPKWIVPIEPANVVLENHAIAIHDSQILDVLPLVRAQQDYQAQTTTYLDHHVVMPGLVNAHTHSPMTLLRGLADDLCLMTWLNQYIWPAEKQFISESFVRDGTELAILEMLRGGTTCFNENYFFTDVIAQTAADMGMRCKVGSIIINFPSAYAQSVADYFTKAEEVHRKWQNHSLVKTCIAPQGPYTVDDENFKNVVAFAEKNNATIHLHLHETMDEIEQSLEHYGKRPIQRMYELGVFQHHVQCIHMVHLTDEEIAQLASWNVDVVHCPQSNLKLASGFSPVKKMMDAGINVALGTDGAASNNDLDMFNEMQTASLLAKAVSNNSTALNAMQSLTMATLNGAKALGLSDQIGSIKAGKQADIIAIDFSGFNTQPCFDPISHLVYSVNSRQVSDVWVAGKHLLHQGEFLNIDSATILQKVSQWQEKIKPYCYKSQKTSDYSLIDMEP